MKIAFDGKICFPMFYQCERCNSLILFERAYIHHNFYFEKIWICKDCHKKYYLNRKG